MIIKTTVVVEFPDGSMSVQMRIITEDSAFEGPASVLEGPEAATHLERLSRKCHEITTTNNYRWPIPEHLFKGGVTTEPVPTPQTGKGS